MHLIWWIFWIVLIFVLFNAFETVPKKRARETPLDILKRRFAAGEISKGDYEEGKAILG